MSIWLFLILLLLLVVALVLALLVPLPRTSKGDGTRTNPQLTRMIFRDDERYWYAGIFYNNPEDPDLFVPKRSGLGWTINIGHPQGKPLLFGILLLPVVIGLVSVIIVSVFHLPATGCHTFGCHP